MGLTKFCPHVIAWNPDVLNFIGRAKPAIIKVVAPWGHDTMKMAEAKKRSPDSLWLLRRYVDNQPLDTPVRNAGQFAAKILSQPAMDELYDIYEDYNEVRPVKDDGSLDVDIIKRYNTFSAEFSLIVQSWGKKHLTGCWSNGQPPDGAWQYLKESLEVADYLSIHNYGWETLPDCPQFALRHRRIFDLLPVKKLMILSEVGITNAVFGGPDLGWKSWETPPNLFAKERRAAAVWAWFLDRINEDPYVVGANAYTTGRLKGDNWGSHDFTPRSYKLVGDYILGHPSPDPYLPNGGNNMKTDSPLATWREGVPLGNYSKIGIDPVEKTKIVLHSTDGTFTQAVNWFLDPTSKVSAHYVVGRGHHGEPKIYQVVKESDIAHHATDWEMNVKSIGIECADDKLAHLTYPQNVRLIDLLKDIVKRRPHIGRSDIILHRDVVATKCPQAIDDEERNEIVAEVFGSSPTPDWEAKYKELRIRVDEVSGLTTQIQLDLDRIVNDDFRDLSRLREAIDKLLE